MDKLNILAVDTSTTEGIVALSHSIGEIYVEKSTLAKESNAFLLPAIQRMLKAANLSLSKLDYIACGIGPGSFVGTRLAVSVCQGLAYATKTPLIALSALDILAHACDRLHQKSSVLVAIDARMQGFYFAEFCRDSVTHLLTRIGPEQFYRLNFLDDNFKKKMSESPALKIGSAWPLLGINLSLECPVLEASDLLDLTFQAIKNNTILKEAHMLLPTYLNDDTNWKKI